MVAEGPLLSMYFIVLFITPDDKGDRYPGTAQLWILIPLLPLQLIKPSYRARGKPRPCRRRLPAIEFHKGLTLCQR